MTDGAVALGSQSAILPDSGISVGITCLQVRDYKELAERVGFEPTLPFRVNTLSKRAPSATRPSLRLFKHLRGFAPKLNTRLGRAAMSRFATFIQERRYLKNVSPSTVSWYTHAFKWLPSESPSQEELKDAVMRMRAKGLKETGCNANIRAINAYLHWNGGYERKCGAGCNHLRIPQLKEPQNILPTLTAAQVSLLVNWRPKAKNFYQRRLHLLTLLLLDTGCRITEALTLRVNDVDLDNMLLTLDGKGRKQRIVPFSFALRKALHRFISEFDRKPDSLLFATRQE